MSTSFVHWQFFGKGSVLLYSASHVSMASFASSSDDIMCILIEWSISFPTGLYRLNSIWFARSICCRESSLFGIIGCIELLIYKKYLNIHYFFVVFGIIIIK